MRRAIIGLVDGAPTNLPIEARLDGDLPALEVEHTAYLDGARVAHGTAAGRHRTEPERPTVTEAGIVTEREHEANAIATDFIADLDGDPGFVGIDTGKAEFLWEVLAVTHSVGIERAVIDCAGFADAVRDQGGDSWQVGYTDGDDAAGVAYHDAADLGAAQGELTQFGFRYSWDGTFVRGTIAASGYVAIFGSLAVDAWARWLRDEVLPHASLPDDVQHTLSTAPTTCEGCEHERDSVEPTPDGALCIVCRDKQDEAAATGGDA